MVRLLGGRVWYMRLGGLATASPISGRAAKVSSRNRNPSAAAAAAAMGIDLVVGGRNKKTTMVWESCHPPHPTCRVPTALLAAGCHYLSITSEGLRWMTTIGAMQMSDCKVD